MTRKLSLLLLFPALAAAQEPAPEPAPDARRAHDPDALASDRTAFEALTERAIGRTSRRVRYDWRKGTAEVGLLGGLPAELNNFDTLRAGAFVRFPVRGFLLGLEASYAWVWGNESSDRIALTPYRQPGRPDRVEVDATFTLPLAEGVVTAWPAFVPAAQLVLQSHVHLRYLLYPGAFEDLGFLDTLEALVSGSLSDQEVANLEDARIPGMAIDRGRYVALVGLGADLYFQSGFFLSHKVLVATPILHFATDSALDFGFELDLSMGLAF